MTSTNPVQSVPVSSLNQNSQGASYTESKGENNQNRVEEKNHNFQNNRDNLRGRGGRSGRAHIGQRQRNWTPANRGPGGKHDGTFHKLLVKTANGELESASVKAQSIHQVINKEAKKIIYERIIVNKDPDTFPSLVDVEGSRLEVHEWMIIETPVEQRLSWTLQLFEWFIYLIMCTFWIITNQIDHIYFYKPNKKTITHYISTKVPVDAITLVKEWWSTKKSKDFTHDNFLESVKYAQYILKPVNNINSIDRFQIIIAVCKHCYPLGFVHSIDIQAFAYENALLRPEFNPNNTFRLWFCVCIALFMYGFCGGFIRSLSKAYGF